jgi:RPE1 domain-containing protein
LITLHQKHGDSVHVIDADNIEEYRFKDPESMLNIHGDAIITNIPGLLIGVQTADCAPILLCDKKNRFIAAIHAGWRGALGNIIENTVETLLSLENNRPLSKPLESELLVGKMAHRTAAYLSVREESSTGLTHQEADYEELWKRSNDIVAAIGPCLQRDSFAVNDEIIDRVDDRYLTHLPDKTLFDMQAYITDKLLRLGVKTVSHVNIDTFTQENFFSYRRQDGHCGVQFSGIILRG